MQAVQDRTTHQFDDHLLLGIDVGSTTVKAVVLDDDDQILWKDYRRHNARQAETVRDFLVEIDEGLQGRRFRLYVTGSGGRGLSRHLEASYIQEVNAVAWATEQRHPTARSVIELGGQDAKVIIRREDQQGRRSTLTFMNDKCAGGTGATIDRIFGKFGLTTEEASQICSDCRTIHHISAKCGVFSETDVVGLLKSGIDREDIFVSLCAAIAKQNLEVLVRGNILMDEVLLLGGPHTFFGVFSDIWRQLIPETWSAHNWTPAQERPLEEVIYVPPDAQYFAALGAALFGWRSQQLTGGDPVVGDGELSRRIDSLSVSLGQARLEKLRVYGSVRRGLVTTEAEKEQAEHELTLPRFEPPALERGRRHRVFVGLDGGSTSTKLVVLDERGELLRRDYVLSRGNPIIDVREMFGRLLDWRKEAEVELDVGGVGVTGYASKILETAFDLDVTVVETVAHMKAAVAEHEEVDVICDVGGQDIKVLFSKHGRVVHFKINTQCSAGNGYFLQAMAEQFGLTVDEYTGAAFKARQAPVFNCGCAVFMEQDRVNFQQLGWTKEEIMAGLAQVLPLNIWHYVVQDTNIAKFGRTFVLQGGTQRNLAAVKAQVDYIRSKVPGARVVIHRHADVCGAIGAALEARDRAVAGAQSRFIGLESAAEVTFESRTDEATRCHSCSNRCPRTFVDICPGDGRTTRYISGARCEKGTAVDLAQARARRERKRELRRHYANLVHQAAVEVFEPYRAVPPPPAGTALPREVGQLLRRLDRPSFRWPKRFRRSHPTAAGRRRAMVVGLPRLLNLYAFAPFFSAYFKALGVGRVVSSEVTSDRLWAEGNTWGAIDPCFPAKVAPAHVHNLLNRGDLTHLCFPMVTYLDSPLERTLADAACVIQMGTPEVVEATFTRHQDVFADRGVTFWKPLLRLDRPKETAGRLLEYFGDRLEITEDENAWATLQGFAALERYRQRLQEAGRETLNWLVDNDRIGVLVIGHPYHHDPGLNHGIPEQFQLRGFPVLCIESLPTDEAFLGPLFPDDEARPFDIGGVWWRNFNRNTNHKIWAATVAARHPNLAVIDLSSFKCGHDAPTYSYIDNILDASETPHFLFHDIDQNRPSATHAIRVETIEYFLRQEEEMLRAAPGRRAR